MKDKNYITIYLYTPHHKCGGGGGGGGGGVSDVWYVYDTSLNDTLSNKPFHVLKVLS